MRPVVRPSTSLGTSEVGFGRHGRSRAGVRFAGYAALFGRVDRGGDVVRAGAFARSLRRGGTVPLFWEHDARRPVGRIEYLREDRRGLRVIGRVTDRAAAARVRRGEVSGLSFGYRVRLFDRLRMSGLEARELSEVELVEVSLVAVPMQPAARVHLIA